MALAAALAAWSATAAAPQVLDRNKVHQLVTDGNYRDALEPLRELTLVARPGQSAAAAEDFRLALDCYRQLNELHSIDAYREEVAKAWKDDWLVLSAVGQSYQELDHQGHLIAGEFERGGHRGGGKVVHATARDRVRALQLFRQAIALVPDDPAMRSSKEAVALLDQFSAALQHGLAPQQSWRLQSLTNLDELPDYEEGWGYYGDGPRGAAVADSGEPVYYDEPASWEASKNDGERWRWALAERTRWAPTTKSRELLERADFADAQFGVQTLADYGWWFARQSEDDSDASKSQFLLDKLGEDETIARLATGVKRLKLPDEQNSVRLWQQVMKDEKPGSDAWRTAAWRLAECFENRRQYPRAAEYWRLLVGSGGSDLPNYVRRLEQIAGNWGRLEATVTQPAGRGAVLAYRFRNGKRVEFTARKIKLRLLFDDLKAYLSSDPKQLDWNQTNIDNLGYRLVVEGQEKYLGREAGRWSLELEPRERHFDRRVSVTTPLQQAGAYLVTAKMEGGNEHHVVVWLADAAIVKKPLAGKALYYLADAASGQPLAKRHVEFFGYRQEPDESRPNRYRIATRSFAEFTDGDGMITLAADEENRQFAWLAVAAPPEPATPDAAQGADREDSLALLGFSGVWTGEYYDQEYKQLKVFTITDRPVYRPGQQVEFKFWVANAQYDAPDESPFAGQSFAVEIHDPRGEKVFSQDLVADAYGGLAGSWSAPASATLGSYQLLLVNHGGGSFRIEEYKKPEFEVTVEAPDKPITLGDSFTAKIRARYYFGSPVAEARVKYKVLRTSRDDRWRPIMPWDWLYGNGYGLLAEDYDWYPGWRRWGCPRPWPWWRWRPSAPPEIVAESEAEIGPDGSIDVTIDTKAALEIHGDQDHAYSIEADVTDQSRRTIVGKGEVLAARRPFDVCVWTDRGFYQAGDTIAVSGAARTMDGKSVAGPGVLRLMWITYESKDGVEQPVENEVARWDLPAPKEGEAILQIKASEPGQYRVVYEVTLQPEANKDEPALKSGGDDDPGKGAADEATGPVAEKLEAESPKSVTIEGGQVVIVRGDKFDGGDFRFNDVEIVPERREYAPGDKARLQVSVNRPGAAVLLFLRPANGIYLPPQVVRLSGKSTVVEVEIAARDMPNFFVEAVTVHGGRLHSTVREIFVPPAKRVINVAVEPSAKEFLPGEKAKIKFRLTDDQGLPLVGSTVVAIYDRALDYIAGGAASGDIREFFWKWRRNHNPQSESNLGRTEHPVVVRNGKEMQNLGVFGETVSELSAESSDRMAISENSYFLEGRAGGRQEKTMLGVAFSRALPMAAAPAEAMADGGGGSGFGGGGETPAAQPTVRQNFADTALWVGSLLTDAEGQGEVELTMPENLTAWKVSAWGMGRGVRVGQGGAEIVTRKNIIVRLQAPRFFVERDEVVLSAVVHNYLKEAKQVEVQLELEGGTLEAPPTVSETVEIPPGGEQRVDWRVKAIREGQAVVRMKALADVESDAMQMSFPVYVHGMLKTESFSGAIRPSDSQGEFTFVVPVERRREQTRLEVRFSPTLAGAMVDALPYLADYPYGCTEQTLNRFLPAVITRQTLRRLGVDLKAIQEKRTNLNAQEIGDDAARAAQWKRFDRNPVFDEAELDAMVKAGVNRLAEMQLSDGGWGWFSGWGEQSSAHTTATVVRGLLVARKNEVALVPGVLERGVDWLERYQREQLAALDNYDRQAGKTRDDNRSAKSRADDLDALVYLTLVEAQRAGASSPPAANASPIPAANASPPANALPSAAEPSTNARRMRDYLYKDRTGLAAYSLATFGLALQQQLAVADPAASGEAKPMLDMILQNLSQYVKQDDENQTAWLDLPGGYWWYWYGSEYEAHAYYLKLLAAAEPKSEVAPRLVKYLLNNRKHATYWNSTRDTALVVEAMADYLQATGEGRPDMTVEVVLDGQVQKTVKIAPAELFTFDNKLVLEGDALTAGKHTVELRKQGEGPLYFNGYLTNFTLEDPIAATGLELKVERRYFKLTPAKKQATVAGDRGQAVEQAVEKYDRTLLEDQAELKSGDLVEVEFVVQSKNDYEYVLLEDMKPAGFEAVEVRSGYTGNELGAYVEFRDDRVALFCRTLARGRHSVSYRLRAEIPGKFSALPTRVSAMYAPELKANGDEAKLQVVDR